MDRKFYAIAEENQGNVFCFITKAARDSAVASHRIEAVAAKTAHHLATYSHTSIEAWREGLHMTGTEKR